MESDGGGCGILYGSFEWLYKFDDDVDSVDGGGWSVVVMWVGPPYVLFVQSQTKY